MIRPSINVVRQRIHSTEQAIVLRRDLEAPHTRPKAAIDIHVRPLTEADVPKILHAGEAASADDVLYRSRRRRPLESGLGTCFAAVTASDEPCYVQWLMGEQDNAQIQSYFGGAFPILEPGTALLEGAFTPAPFRGKGIMGLAMSLIAEKAADLESRYVITVVGTDNIPSLKGCGRGELLPVPQSRGVVEHAAAQGDVRTGSPHLRPTPPPRTPTAKRSRRRIRRWWTGAPPAARCSR